MDSNKIGRFLGVLIAVAFLTWIVPAITVIVWDILASVLLTEIVNAGLLPASITWAQAFAMCAFFLAVSGYTRTYSSSNK